MTINLHREWTMGVISNSETSMFNTCQRKHFYAFGQRLAPKRMSQGLTRGILGHEILAEWYRLLRQGDDVAQATDEALKLFNPFFVEAVTNGDEEYTDLLTALKIRVSEYMKIYATDVKAWDILEVESEYRTTLPSGMEYAMRLDLLVRAKSGPYTGELVLVDHKFVYDFYKEDALALNPQMPKYLGILNANGINVQVAVLNQIRTRVNKSKPMTDEDKFRRSYLKPTPTEITTIFKEELVVAREIDRLRNIGDPLIWEANVIRNMGSMTCPMCPYASLCKSDLMGQDTRLQKMMDFEEPVYGYESREA